MTNPPIISTKINVPRTCADVVVRPRLTEMLDEGFRRPSALMLISAPAGYGKTTLGVNWLLTSGKPYAWLSLGPEDDSLPRFTAYLIAALQKSDSTLGHAAQQTLESFGAQPLIDDTIISSLNEGLSNLAQPIILVLEDYHCIESVEVHNFVESLIEHIHLHLRVLITTRTDPPFALARWRVRNQLVEIRTHDLQFTLEEATEFLQRVMTLELSRQDIHLLTERTEGWVAGLQLAALSIQNHQNRSPLWAIDGSHRDISDYLMSEVVGQLPQERKEFLLQTSLVDRLNASLCNAMTGCNTSQILLETLEIDNLFILALDDTREWFRYHQLFAEFLRKRLLAEYPEDVVKELHHRASHWFAEHADILSAIDHALAAKDFEYAARLISPQSQRWMEHGDVSAILKYLNELPHEMTWKQWNLTLWYGWVYAVRGELTSAELWTNRLEELISPQIERAAQNGKESIPQDLQNAYAQVLAIRSVIARENKDFASAIAFGEQALQIVPEGNQNLQATIATLLSSAILESGDFDEAESLMHSTRQRVSHNGNSFITFTLLLNASALAVMRGQLHRAHDLNEEALRLTQTKSMESLAFLPQLRLGRIHYFWNQLAKAKEIVTTALEQADLEHYTEAVIRGQITLAWIQNVEGQYPQALQTLAVAEHWAIDHHKHESAEIVKAVRAQSQFWAGEKEAVMSWMKALGWDIFNPSQSGTLPNDEAFFLLCQVLIKAEAWQRVQVLLAWRMADSQVQRRDSTILKIHLMQALLHRTQDDLDLAMQALSQALELAMPEDFIRPFLDEGRQLLSLLRRISKKHPAKDFAQKILACQSSAPNASLMIEPLSKQELTILQLMAQGRTNPEIAHLLVLAVSTVRWYAKQIFRKLGVHNRTQAAAQAKKLNLI